VTSFHLLLVERPHLTPIVCNQHHFFQRGDVFVVSELVTAVVVFRRRPQHTILRCYPVVTSPRAYGQREGSPTAPVNSDEALKVLINLHGEALVG
jgi:hypothetical protein